MHDSARLSVDSPVSTTFPVDIEHAGIRLALPVIMVLAFIGAFVIFGNLFAVESPVSCLPIAGGVVAAIFATMIGDNLLKRIWRSPRSVTISPSAIEYTDKQAQNPTIRMAWDDRINALAWRFTVKRGSARVPKGWVMLGCQLTQDEHRLTLYAFLPEKDAAAPEYKAFTQLVPRADVEKLPLREANRQRRLLIAEDERWQGGAEIPRAHFAGFVSALSQNIPDWGKE
jgi:hypothetical protein